MEQNLPAGGAPVEPPVMPRLYEPWNAIRKTTKTNNIGIYNRVGELVATLNVHPSATAETQERRMREARMIAAAPELVVAANALKAAVQLGHSGWNVAADKLEEAMAKAGFGAA